MIEDELKIRRLKFEQINTEVKTNASGKPGKLGSHQINPITDSSKVSNISKNVLKNSKETT